MITLKTLPQVTPQQVFDHVKEHLLKQNAKSFGYVEKCVYRNAEGLKCAAGCLISEEEYQGAFEGQSWSSVAERIGIFEHEQLISDLQEVHDQIKVENWEEGLRIIAVNYNLKYN